MVRRGVKRDFNSTFVRLSGRTRNTEGRVASISIQPLFDYQTFEHLRKIWKASFQFNLCSIISFWFAAFWALRPYFNSTFVRLSVFRDVRHGDVKHISIQPLFDYQPFLFQKTTIHFQLFSTAKIVYFFIKSCRCAKIFFFRSIDNLCIVLIFNNMSKNVLGLVRIILCESQSSTSPVIRNYPYCFALHPQFPCLTIFHSGFWTE